MNIYEKYYFENQELQKLSRDVSKLYQNMIMNLNNVAQFDTERCQAMHEQLVQKFFTQIKSEPYGKICSMYANDKTGFLFPLVNKGKLVGYLGLRYTSSNEVRELILYNLESKYRFKFLKKKNNSKSTIIREQYVNIIGSNIVDDKWKTYMDKSLVRV